MLQWRAWRRDGAHGEDKGAAPERVVLLEADAVYMDMVERTRHDSSGGHGGKDVTWQHRGKDVTVCGAHSNQTSRHVNLGGCDGNRGQDNAVGRGGRTTICMTEREQRRAEQRDGVAETEGLATTRTRRHQRTH